MPTRKKVAAKKAQAKKPVPRPAKAKTVKLEVVSDVPNLMPSEVMDQILLVETVLGQMDDMTELKLCTTIQRYAERATGYSQSALKSGASALVYAWACGKLLNAAKAKFGRGGFGKWRDANLVPYVMSERTSQRYMKLADTGDDVRELLEWSPSLRQAYIACGILPESERGAGDDDKDEAPNTHVLLASLSGLQKKLRLYLDSREKLGKRERTQLALVRDELNRFFEQVLG
jgi:hypothetical protein